MNVRETPGFFKKEYPITQRLHICEETVNIFLNEYYIDKINKRQDKIIYQQPMIVLLYILAKDHHAELEESWCFTPDMLCMVFSDLGLTSNDDY
ncbi:MAG: hypothetical protein HDR06_10285 [Lachnospiraceae bacterium]|nr:hypothetical protein [Lachnospiraceae bacterium]